jgi:SNF2 family DNA or RNA helicase
MSITPVAQPKVGFVSLGCAKALVDSERILTRLRAEGYRCVTIVGGMSAQAKDYAKNVFQTGQAQVCLATTQAGGVGLTLTAASCVVFLSRPFSIVDALQAEDRAHRIGSERHKVIDVVDIVTTDSVDQRVAEILRERGMSLQDFLTGAESVRALLKGGKR